ncbi:MAG: GAF domain-containing protein [Bdellovibrionia bacterium]
MGYARGLKAQKSNSVSNPSRLSALVNTGLLDGPVEAAFERLTSLAARTIHAPVSLVSLVDRERQFFKSAFGLPEPWLSMRETPLTYSFCRHVVDTQKPLLIEDAEAHPLVKKNLAVGALHVIAYAGMPLLLSNGQCIGSFCVIDHKPRIWHKDEIGLLSDIADSVMAEIDLRLMMAAKEELFDLVIHDLKNLLNTNLLNTYLAIKKIKDVHNPGLYKNLDMLRTSSECMKGIIQNIGDLSQLEKGDLPLNLACYSSREIISSVITKVTAVANQVDAKITHVGEDSVLINCDRDRITQSLNDLVAVMARRSDGDKVITIQTQNSPEYLCIEILDQGPPFTSDDIAHFFDRFVKSPSLPNRGAKLAICLAKEIINAHKGEIWVEASTQDQNRIRVNLPLAQSIR